MAVMTTTLSNDGLVLEHNTHPVPSSEKMALDLDINGTANRDETNLDFEISKPAVIPNVVEPSTNLLGASEIHIIQNNEAAIAANDRLLKDVDKPVVEVGEPAVIGGEAEATAAIEEPLTITNIDEVRENKTDAEHASNEIKTATSVTLEPTSSIDTSQADSSFDPPSAATTIPPLVEPQESDLREPLRPVSQIEAADLQATKHAMDLQADPELANGLQNTGGNDIIERNIMNGEGMSVDSQHENAPADNSIHSTPVEGDSQKTHNIENLQIASASQSMTEQPSESILREPTTDIHMSEATADIQTPEADNTKQDADMADAFEEPAQQTQGNKVARPREEEDGMDIDVPEAKRFKAGSDVNGGDAADTGDVGDAQESQRLITPDIQRLLKNSLQSARKAKVGFQFRLPVVQLWPGLADAYVLKVVNPMDLSTLEKNLSKGDYATIGEYKDDIHLIYTNAVLFNGAEHDVAKSALELEAYLHNKIPAADFVPPASKSKGSRKSTPARDVAARRPSRAVQAASPPVAKAKAESYPLDPVSQMPVIRRDSTIGDGGRPKREIHPPKPKDVFTQPNTKTSRKKNALELRFCEWLLQEIMKSKNNSMNQFFMIPVDATALGIPTYHQIIKKPMDLSTIQQKLANNSYMTAKEFEADFKLMLNNCFLFNPPDNMVHQKGRDLERYFLNELRSKEAWMAANGGQREAHASADSDEEQSDDGEEEAPPARNDERNFLTSKILEEQDKLIRMTTSKVNNQTEIRMQGQIVELCKQNLQKLDEEIAAAATTASKKNKKSKAPPKPTKKNSTTAPPAKKSKKPKMRYLGHREKEIISTGIQHLDERSMQTVITWIKADVDGLEAVDDNEMELDIDSVSDACLNKLFDLIMLKVPGVQNMVNAEEPAQAPLPPPPAAKPKKKNKPMGKSEQERKIAQLQQVVGAGLSAPTAPAAQRYGESGPGKIMSSIEREEDTSGDEDETDSEEE